MPLTPAEVHNVAFKKPPIGKRGYDEEEVDAFLDIIEVELARLIEENNDLRTRGAGGEDGRVPADAAADSAAAAELSAAMEENGRLRSHIEELERALSQGADGTQQQVVQLQQKLTETEQQLEENRRELEQAKQAGAQAQQGQPGPQQSEDVHARAVQVLMLAQQTADQHLAQSMTEAERILAEAKAQADNTLKAAQERSTAQLGEVEARAKKLDEESAARATRAVQDAEQRVATITAQLEQRKAALERRVEELRTFEREYRTRLKSYLESQLRDLDAGGKPDTTPNASGSAGAPEYAAAKPQR
jgi:DivIVA domain-containing protein